MLHLLYTIFVILKWKNREGVESCVDFQLGLWISANSVGNINKAKSLQKSRKQFASRQKGSHQKLSRLYIYTYIFISGLNKINLFHSCNLESLFNQRIASLIRGIITAGTELPKH